MWKNWRVEPTTGARTAAAGAAVTIIIVARQGIGTLSGTSSPPHGKRKRGTRNGPKHFFLLFFLSFSLCVYLSRSGKTYFIIIISRIIVIGIRNKYIYIYIYITAYEARIHFSHGKVVGYT